MHVNQCYGDLVWATILLEFMDAFSLVCLKGGVVIADILGLRENHKRGHGKLLKAWAICVGATLPVYQLGIPQSFSAFWPVKGLCNSLFQNEVSWMEGESCSYLPISIQKSSKLYRIRNWAVVGSPLMSMTFPTMGNRQGLQYQALIPSWFSSLKSNETAVG